MLGISSFCICVPKITIKWRMVPEIWSATARIFCHFGPIFALLLPYQTKKIKFLKIEKSTWRYYQFTHVYQKWQWYDVWFLRYGAWQSNIFVILDSLFPFYPPNYPKSQNFKKLKKKNLELLSFYTFCAINGNHKIYGSWDIERNRDNFLSFWTIFCTFTRITTWKTKIKKK